LSLFAARPAVNESPTHQLDLDDEIVVLTPKKCESLGRGTRRPLADNKFTLGCGEVDRAIVGDAPELAGVTALRDYRLSQGSGVRRRRPARNRDRGALR
jgi:hypothetical protein